MTQIKKYYCTDFPLVKRKEKKLPILYIFVLLLLCSFAVTFCLILRATLKRVLKKRAKRDFFCIKYKEYIYVLKYEIRRGGFYFIKKKKEKKLD